MEEIGTERAMTGRRRMIMGEEDGREQRGVMTKPRRRKTQDARPLLWCRFLGKDCDSSVTVSFSLSLSRRDGTVDKAGRLLLCITAAQYLPGKRNKWNATLQNHTP